MRRQPHQPPAVKGPAISGSARDTRPNFPALAAGVLYLAVLAALCWLPGWAMGTAAALFVLLAAAALSRRHRRDAAALAALWPPLHFLVLLTGSTASPLIALAAAWVAGFGRFAPRLALPAAVAAAVLVPAGELLRGDSPATVDGLRWLLLVGVALAFALVRGKGGVRPAHSAEAEPAPEVGQKQPGPATDEKVLEVALEVVRRATDAHEAALWRADGGADSGEARLVARAASPGVAAPASLVPLEGHPFKLTLDEQVPQRWERGRKDLPSPWAAEMLMVPVDAPAGVLALAYPGIVPPGAEGAAVRAGEHLASLLALLRTRASARREEGAMRALVEAARTLPGELDPERFAAHLAATVVQATGAAGAAVALAPDDTGKGRVLHASAAEGSPPRLGEYGDGDSRLALAVKHGVELAYDDLAREPERLPLCSPGEEWEAPPRSAALQPLLADGRALGAVVAWHPQPGRFGAREREFLRLLCSLAPLPLRSASRFVAVEQKATTDSLTGLPNRRTFEEKLASAASRFDRYGRPFTLVALDVDHFKKVNDTWGHAAGDRVLQEVAAVLRASVRDLDVAARIGGEEFVVLLPETGLHAGGEAAERIRRTIEGRSLVWDGRPLSVTVSLGVVSVPDCTATPSEALKLADEALYRSKGGGRNRVSLAPKVGKGTAADV